MSANEQIAQPDQTAQPDRALPSPFLHEVGEQGPAYDEWTAWLQLCGHLKRLGVDINDPKSEGLHRALHLWGERVHGLRVAEPDQAIEARAEAESKYADHVLPNT